MKLPTNNYSTFATCPLKKGRSMILQSFIILNPSFGVGSAIMEKKLKSDDDLAKAYQGEYEGFDINLRRISNEAKARKSEYDGFGTYLRRISQEAIAKRGDH